MMFSFIFVVVFISAFADEMMTDPTAIDCAASKTHKLRSV